MEQNSSLPATFQEAKPFLLSKISKNCIYVKSRPLDIVLMAHSVVKNPRISLQLTNAIQIIIFTITIHSTPEERPTVGLHARTHVDPTNSFLSTDGIKLSHQAKSQVIQMPHPKWD